MIRISSMFFCIILPTLAHSLFSNLLGPTSFELYHCFTKALEKGKKNQASNLLTKIYKQKGVKKVDKALRYALDKFYLYPVHGEIYISTLIKLRQFRGYLENNQQKIADYFLAQHRPPNARGTLLDIAAKRSYNPELLQNLYALQPIPPISLPAQRFLELESSMSS